MRPSTPFSQTSIFQLTVEDIRRLTPSVENCAYFQTSGFPPKPVPVLEEVTRWMYFQNQGPAVPWVHETMEAMVEDTRKSVASVLHAHPDEIMLSENTTIGINIVAYGLNWRRGDNVILSDHEHPGNCVVWYHLAQRFGIEIRCLRLSNSYDAILAQFEALLDSRTRLVSISHVSRETGLRLPAKELTEIAHAHHVPILFDGAQAFGAIPVDLQAIGCDFYTCSGHKYIMAPQATGIFFIRRDCLDWLYPSWLGSHSEKHLDKQAESLELKDSARRFEFGTRNLADIAGLRKALELWHCIGWENVFQAIARYTTWLKEQLLRIPGLELLTPLEYERSSGIVTFRLLGLDPATVCSSLYEKEKVLVAPVTDGVRVSTHVFNTQEDGERLLCGLRRILRQGY